MDKPQPAIASTKAALSLPRGILLKSRDETTSTRSKNYLSRPMRFLKSKKRRPKPPVEFHRFLQLPDELQIRILQLALCEPTLVEVHLPGSCTVRGTTTAIRGLHSELPAPTILQVCHKFRKEGIRFYPLAFGVSLPDLSGTMHLLPPMIRFNFETDMLAIPQAFLQQPTSFFLHDMHRVKALLILWDASLKQAMADRLLTCFPNVERIELAHYVVFSKSSSSRTNTGSTASNRDKRQLQQLRMLMARTASTSVLPVNLVPDVRLYFDTPLRDSKIWLPVKRRIVDSTRVRAFELKRLIKETKHVISLLDRHMCKELLVLCYDLMQILYEG